MNEIAFLRMCPGILIPCVISEEMINAHAQTLMLIVLLIGMRIVESFPWKLTKNCGQKRAEINKVMFVFLFRLYWVPPYCYFFSGTTVFLTFPLLHHSHLSISCPPLPLAFMPWYLLNLWGWMGEKLLWICLNVHAWPWILPSMEGEWSY